MPLRLRGYSFIYQRCEAVIGHISKEPTKVVHDTSFRIVTTETDNMSMWMDLSVNTDDSENLKYDYCLTAIINFEVTGDFNRDEAIKSLSEHGPQVLLGAVREKLFQLTSSGPWDAQHIDIVDWKTVPILSLESTSTTNASKSAAKQPGKRKK